jgi:hypothetical protein
LQCLYGTGAIKLNDDNIVERVGGVVPSKITLSKQMLRDVKAMVDKKKKRPFQILSTRIVPQG